MEKVALDMAACVRDAKERLVQSRAGGVELARHCHCFIRARLNSLVVATPTGEPPDLAAASTHPADGMLLLAAHIGRSQRCAMARPLNSG